jgi:hypothetical protein
MPNPDPLGRVDGVAFLLGLVGAGRRQQTGGRSRPWPRPGCRAARSRPGRSPGPGAGSRLPSRANGPGPGRARPPRRAAAPAPPGGAGGTGDQDHGLLHRVQRSSGYPPTSLPRTPVPAREAGHLPCSTSPVQVRQRGATQHAPDIAPRSRTTRVSSNQLLAGSPAELAPTPAAYPSPPGLDPPATPPGRRPSRAGAPAVTEPLTTRRQRRRRITPNTNTSTTTMISTHNHVDMAASLVGAGAVQADATAAHPSKQLGHRQATSRPRIDGRAPTRRTDGRPGFARPESRLVAWLAAWAG